MVAELVAEVPMPAFGIRPPRGFRFAQRPAPHGATAFVWRGAARPDGTAPHLRLVIGPPPQPMPTVETALDRLLEDARRPHEEWQRTSTEVGQVNGVTFGRVRWSGIEPATGARTHGFIYVAVEGRSTIELSSQDLEPYHENALKVAEASALTFRKL